MAEFVSDFTHCVKGQQDCTFHELFGLNCDRAVCYESSKRAFQQPEPVFCRCRASSDVLGSVSFGRFRNHSAVVRQRSMCRLTALSTWQTCWPKCVNKVDFHRKYWKMKETLKNHISVICEGIGIGFEAMGPLGLGLYFGPVKVYFGLLFQKRTGRRQRSSSSIRTIVCRLDEVENVENRKSRSLT